jgi:integrase
MASLRTRTRADGTQHYAVLYRLQGKQTSTTFYDFEAASKFCDLATKFGPENALATLKVDSTLATLTVEQWLNHHVEHLTGVDPNTVAKYRAYIRNDLSEPLGSLPLAALTRDHIVRWIKGMQKTKANGKVPGAKTIGNKHGFLAGALNGAVNAGHITANPCVGIGLPRDDDPREMVCLTSEQFQHLLSHVTEPWRPMVEFMVASGARWGEVAALRPSDVNRDEGTVRITRSWKQDSKGGYRLGATKTKKGKRTINVPKSTLDKLDYSGEFLFTNRAGGPVRAQGFSSRVWAKAVERAWPSTDADGKPVKDRSRVVLRPRIHDLRHTNASWQIQAGIPLPVVQQHMGHEDIRTTVAVYGHLDRRSMQAAADVIGAVLTGPS